MLLWRCVSWLVWWPFGGYVCWSIVKHARESSGILNLPENFLWKFNVWLALYIASDSSMQCTMLIMVWTVPVRWWWYTIAVVGC